MSPGFVENIEINGSSKLSVVLIVMIDAVANLRRAGLCQKYPKLIFSYLPLACVTESFIATAVHVYSHV